MKDKDISARYESGARHLDIPGGLSSSPPNLIKQFAATPFSQVSYFLTGKDNVTQSALF
jgi:hypothetical protein